MYTNNYLFDNSYLNLNKIDLIQQRLNLNFDNELVKEFIKTKFQYLNIEPMPYFEKFNESTNNGFQVLNNLLQKKCFTEQQLIEFGNKTVQMKNKSRTS